jgi:uncharacterized membrane protein (UPF0127 family)
VRLDHLPSIRLDGGLRVAVADTRRARCAGLAGLHEMEADVALLLPRCRSIHTFGMRFAIDVVFLDGEGEVLRCVRSVPGRRVVTCWKARATMETRAGCAERFLAAGVLANL